MISQAYTKTHKSIISKLYKILRDSKQNPTDYIRIRWQKEINTEISLEQWDNICKTIHTTSCSAHWREFNWKNIVRYFVTPKQQLRINSASSNCWRDCGEDNAHHTHIFWSCIKIKSYWTEVGHKIEQIMGFKMPQTMLTLYFGDLPAGISNNDKYLLKIIIATAKKAITRKWLNTDPPTIEDWIKVTKETERLERLTFMLRLQPELYFARWGKWSRLYNDQSVT